MADPDAIIAAMDEKLRHLEEDRAILQQFIDGIAGVDSLKKIHAHNIRDLGEESLDAQALEIILGSFDRIIAKTTERLDVLLARGR